MQVQITSNMLSSLASQTGVISSVYAKVDGTNVALTNVQKSSEGSVMTIAGKIASGGRVTAIYVKDASGNVLAEGTCDESVSINSTIVVKITLSDTVEGGITEAPDDGKQYARQNRSWKKVRTKKNFVEIKSSEWTTSSLVASVNVSDGCVIDAGEIPNKMNVYFCVPESESGDYSELEIIFKVPENSVVRDVSIKIGDNYARFANTPAIFMSRRVYKIRLVDDVQEFVECGGLVNVSGSDLSVKGAANSVPVEEVSVSDEDSEVVVKNGVYTKISVGATVESLTLVRQLTLGILCVTGFEFVVPEGASGFAVVVSDHEENAIPTTGPDSYEGGKRYFGSICGGMAVIVQEPETATNTLDTGDVTPEGGETTDSGSTDESTEG